MSTPRRLASILREPVLTETRRNLARSWARVLEALRAPQQMLGRGGNGCGATIGAMPRCDFACVGCYLGEEANRVPAEPVDGLGGGVAVETLWARIAEGLYGQGTPVERIGNGQMSVGHPGCNRYLPGVVVTEPGRAPRFEALRQSGNATDERIVDGVVQRFGGISFRRDGRLERAALCIFQVPVDGRLVSMCEVNALGIRDGYYDRLRRRRHWPY